MSFMTAPASDFIPITASDTVDIPPTRGIYIVGDGVIRVLTCLGTERTIPVGDKSLLPLQIQRVYATGTAGVTSLFAVY